MDAASCLSSPLQSDIISQVNPVEFDMQWRSAELTLKQEGPVFEMASESRNEGDRPMNRRRAVVRAE